MSVYIKGMEMPKSCDDCRIMVFEDTNCVPELYCGCPIVFKAHPQGIDHRPDYCPLVLVPPHGRLIDADALMKDGWRLYRRKIDGHGGICGSEMPLSSPSIPTFIEAEVDV